MDLQRMGFEGTRGHDHEMYDHLISNSGFCVNERCLALVS
jgi:hypothetical protein